VRGLVVFLAAVSLLVAWAAPVMAQETMVEKWYREYEALNTPKNLAIRHVGGRPPTFIDEQAKLLDRIAKRTTTEAAPFVVKIVDKYLERVHALGRRGFGASPLQALQGEMIRLMRRHAGDNKVFSQLTTFAAEPLLKEYARGRALGALAEWKLKAVPKDEDKDGKARATLLLETVVGDISLSRLLHAPSRCWQTAMLSAALERETTLELRTLLNGAANTRAKRYTADFVFVDGCFRKVMAKKPLTEAENAAVLEVCKGWLSEFRPIVLKEKYPSDVLGRVLLALAGRTEHAPLVALLKQNGLEPTPYVPPTGKPARPGTPRL